MHLQDMMKREREREDREEGDYLRLEGRRCWRSTTMEGEGVELDDRDAAGRGLLLEDRRGGPWAYTAKRGECREPETDPGFRFWVFKYQLTQNIKIKR